MKFVGIDASLSRTGVAVYDTGTGRFTIKSIPSTNDDGTLEGRDSRILRISSSIVDSIGDDVELVAIEGPAFSSSTGKVWDRAGLWWAIVRSFIVRGTSIMEIPPTSRAKYATGNGRANKDTVLIAVTKAYPDADIKNNDEADALILCVMAARIHGYPVEETITKDRLEAITKLIKE